MLACIQPLCPCRGPLDCPSYLRFHSVAAARTVHAPCGRGSPVVLLLLLLSLVCGGYAEWVPAPVQHHVQYSGSHFTSIALHSGTGELYVTDVVHNRVIRFDSGGRVAAVWGVGEPPLYSSTSVSYYDDKANPALYVTDSTTRAVLSLDPNSGERNDSMLFVMPSDVWECGHVVAVAAPQSALYVFDRYRGFAAKFATNDSVNCALWPSGPAPYWYEHIPVTYLASATVWNVESGVVYVVDGVGDQVWRLSTTNGWLMKPEVIRLPGNVTGIRAICWTRCTRFDTTNAGCLWIMYQPGRSSGAERLVMAVVVQDGAVVHKWTIAADGAGREGDGAGMAASAGVEVEQQWQAGNNAHLASPALLVTGRGVDSDPFRVFIGEADPDGPGHIVVVRDEAGGFVRRYDSIPSQPDVSTLMHAFSAVQAEGANCTLWLTDMDNGGLLLRTAADGSILQKFETPSLFSAVALDVSNASSPTLVLLSTNATGWQLWRFFPDTGSFESLNTTAVQRQYGSSSVGREDGSVAVGGLAVDSAGRLLLSLVYADTVVLLNADGEWDATFNASSAVVHPATAAAFVEGGDVVVVDRSDLQDQAYFKLLASTSGALLSMVPLGSSMSRPLALMYDGRGSLWMSDDNGMLYQLDSATLTVVPADADGDWQRVFRPMPAAYNLASLSMGRDGVLYATDRPTRRLIMLFLAADGAVRPSSKPCSPDTAPSFSSSSPTCHARPAPAQPGKVAGSVEPLVIGVVCAAVVSVLVALLFAYYWARRRNWSRRRSSVEAADAQLLEDCRVSYDIWHNGLDTEPSLYQRAVTLGVATDCNGADGRTSNVKSVTGQRSPSPCAGGGSQGADASDGRFEAYKRLYEALYSARDDGRNEPSFAQRRMNGPIAKGSASLFNASSSSARGHSDDSWLRAQETSEPLLSPRPTSAVSSPPARQSKRFMFPSQAGGDGKSAAPLPRFLSRLLPLPSLASLPA